MAFDYKREYKEFYLPKSTPGIVRVPSMNFVAVRGEGDPNAEGGEYQRAMGILYGLAFTIKMSKMGEQKLKGYFDFVVPPLEGFWWQEGICGVDYAHKETFQWISLIRLPEFVTEDVVKWAVAEATRKKKMDFSAVEFMTWQEDRCVQCMHVGPYDNEPETLQKMQLFMQQQGLVSDFSPGRYHHEIYLSDVRRCRPENLKTVIRHPVR